jgi:signal peptidase I
MRKRGWSLLGGWNLILRSSSFSIPHSSFSLVLHSLRRVVDPRLLSFDGISMANKKTTPDRREAKPAETRSAEAKSPETKTGHDFVMFRETLESIVVAFVLAFLFRSFEAEAFVIPTGSMSPSLQGQHKDVHCLQCGHRFRTTASSEGENRDRLMARLRGADPRQAVQIKAAIESLDVVGGMCPMCRYLMPMRPDLPRTALAEAEVPDIEYQPSYPGDRILVNKYGLDFSEPERWDVVVFKFPGDGNMNYIKRLVGLPGEQLQLYQGDVFTRALGDESAEFLIERKPVDKVEAMLELVHDTDYEPSTLYNVGWPLRWAATTPDGWKVDAKPGEQTVSQQFSIDTGKDAPMAWLRYRHQLPDEAHWQVARRAAKEGGVEALAKEAKQSVDDWNAEFQKSIHPQLIVDFNSYNARLLRGFAQQHGWQIQPNSGQDSGSFGTEWVGDLAVDATVEVEEARGELALDLVEAGNHFRATINLADGKVALSAVDGRTGDSLDFKASGQTNVDSPGTYEIRFANVDDQLLLWVDGELVDLGDATYDPDKLLPGGRKGMIPWASENSAEDQGDLAPVGVGAQDAKLTITRLAVLRDIYYIATKYPDDPQYLADYDPPAYGLETLFSTPDYWNVFAGRRKHEFDVEEGQLFVMGDNSPESKDCRLWMMPGMSGDHPGGPYLDRRLLIGKAVSVFWPHSWGSIPFLKALPGFPNFGDMRIVR